MKYIKMAEGLFREVGDAEYTAWQDAPKENRPVFLAATNAEVKVWLASLVPVITSVTARQAHEALIRKGLIDNIRNAIAKIADPVEKAVAENWFEKSNTFERSNATLKAVAGSIGLTAGDIDNLFKYAATL